MFSRAVFRARPRLLSSRFGFRRLHDTPTSSSRIDRVISRLPLRLQKYARGLGNAPASHVASFLILHEITAIVPLIALFGLFHYTTYVPVSYMSRHFGSYVDAGAARFERYFTRKKWFGFGEETKLIKEDSDDGTGSLSKSEAAIVRWKTGEEKYRVVVEIALAYAITKVLLPLRIMASVWATPSFATLMLRIGRAVGRKGRV